MENDPIIKRLLGTKKPKMIFEAGEDEEENFEAPFTEEGGDEADDSQAPNITPEEADEENLGDEDSSPGEEDSESSSHSPNPTTSGGSSAPSRGHGAGEGEKTKPPVPREPVEGENPNPLDNTYAVQFTIGDPVSVSYSDGSKSKVTGTIEGYDKEGFYRVKWSDGTTTNGLTDIALAGLTTRVKESVCICGSKNFVTEGNHVICDECGRKIREARADDRKKIRSEQHPISTKDRPSIDDVILDALKRK